jgi:putative glutamine amidotransferase
MKTFISFLLILLGSFQIVFACELPKGEKIKVGCTYECDFFYRFRLIMTGWGLGYTTEFVNLHAKLDVKKAMSLVDGILLPGGADIDPKYYLDSVTPELQEYTKTNLHLVNFSQEGEERDPFEYQLVQTYSRDEQFKKLPMLGICRGLQMMSVAQGLPLYLDIATELKMKNRYNLFDQVNIESGENYLFDGLYKKSSIQGFKYHHQGIRVPYYKSHQDKYPQIRLSAFSHDQKIAETIEYTHRPALGVQFHPEKSFPPTSAPIFKWFLKKACEYKNASRKEMNK